MSAMMRATAGCGWLGRSVGAAGGAGLLVMLLTGVALAAETVPSAPGPDSPQPVEAQQPDPHGGGVWFAEVNGHGIGALEFEQAILTAQRQKFYHGKPPEAEVLALYREVADQLIDRVLLAEEAKRRGLQADEAAIAAQVSTYDTRYGGNANWKANRAALLPGLTEKLREQDVLRQLEAAVRVLPAPTEAEGRAYFEAHPDLFTEPEKVNLSAILLRVDPSSPNSVWEKAREEAAAIRRRILAGAEFAEQARLHSADASADRGGEMGYVHRGMLPEGMQKYVDALQPSQLSEPIDVLEGVALVYLADRQHPRKMEFAKVAERAKDLYARERSEKVWADFIAELRGKASIRTNAQRYPFLNTRDAQGR